MVAIACDTANRRKLAAKNLPRTLDLVSTTIDDEAGGRESLHIHNSCYT